MNTAEYYKKNPKARAKRLAYQKKFNAKPAERARRVALVKINREKGTYGNGDGMDASHTKKGIVMKKESVNRGSNSDMPGDRRARPMVKIGGSKAAAVSRGQVMALLKNLRRSK
jgi:hypothetical protein